MKKLQHFLTMNVTPRFLVFAVYGILVMFGCFYTCFFVPVRLSVSVVPDRIYAGDLLKYQDFKVKRVSLFGVPCGDTSFTYNVSSGNETVTIQSEKLQKTVKLHPMKAKELTGSYDGSLYVGQEPDVAKIRIDALYEDGQTKPVEKIWLDEIPVGNVMQVKKMVVHTNIKDVTIKEIPVIRPSELTATYLGSAVVGDILYTDRCSVLLQYPDGTSFRTQEYVLHENNKLDYERVRKEPALARVPVYLSEVMNLHVLTPYGNTVLSIHPEIKSSVQGIYEDESIYEGDMLDDNKVSVVMSSEEKEVQSVKDYMFQNPGYLQISSVLKIPTKYGEASMPIQVIPVKSITAQIGDDVQEGDSAKIHQLILTYQDDTERVLDTTDVTWLSLPKTWSKTQDVWFLWHGKEYCVTVHTITKDTVKNRGSYQGTTYQYTDDVVRQVALICQRIGNDDVAVNQAELSLMLNRYELYGSGKAGSGKDLLSFVLDSGYWGNRESILAITAKSTVRENIYEIVKDTLSSGYRTLPLYTDERLDASDFSQTAPVVNEMLLQQSSGLVSNEDGNEIVQPEKPVWFVADVSNIWYGYTKDAYRRVEGQDPPESNVNGDDLIDIID